MYKSTRVIVEKAGELLGGYNELAEKLGVSRQCVWLWRNEMRSPSSSFTLKMLQMLENAERHEARSQPKPQVPSYQEFS